MNLILTPFQALIKARYGLVLNDENSLNKLTRAIKKHMALCHIEQADQFLAHLSQSTTAFQDFINDLTINETYFFREASQIQFLAQTLMPTLLKANAQNGLPTRILSAGCSSGEEAYSIAIALTEQFGIEAAHQWQIVGGDIDSSILAKARAAKYSDFSFRGVPADIQHRYFEKHGSATHLKSQIVKQVEFIELNVIEPCPNSSLAPFDVIFFRNVSIYFDKPTRKTILQNLQARLKPEGYLLVGSAETLANELGVMPLISNLKQFYFQNIPYNPAQSDTHSKTHAKSPPQSETANELDENNARQAAHQPLKTVDIELDHDKLKEWVHQKRFDDALPLAEIHLLEAPKNRQTLLLTSYVLLNRKKWLESEKLAKAALELDQWCFDATLLLGMNAKYQGNLPEAISWFKKAIYAHSEAWPAHYYLADAYRQTHPEMAKRSYKSTLKLLGQQPDNVGVNTIPLDLNPAEIEFLSNHHIAKMTSNHNNESTL